MKAKLPSIPRIRSGKRGVLAIISFSPFHEQEATTSESAGLSSPLWQAGRRCLTSGNQDNFLD
jgi:hypothetical protein